MIDSSAGLAKRLFDVTLAALMLTALLPVMAVLAALVKLDSSGPVFYRQLRVGINNRLRARRRLQTRRRRARPTLFSSSDGQRAASDRRGEDCFGRPFPVIKFRTMTVNAESDGPTWCQADDPRVTRIGSVLRKTHMDELPQLVNILKGEMSLVGPRPERPEFVVRLNERIPGYKHRLVIPPGLTGLAQIRHRADIVIDDVKKKIRYDFLYLRNVSLATDLKIIAGTVPRMFGVPSPTFRRLRQARRSAERKLTLKRAKRAA